MQELRDLMAKQQADQERARREAERRHKQQMRQSYIQQQGALQSQINDKTTEYNQIHQGLLDIQEQIAAEEKSMVDFSDEKDDPNAKIVILVGNTGDGKSTFANRLVGDTSMMADQGPFRTSDRGRSCTQNLSKQRTEINNVKITVVDAPGWNDSDGRDRTHANNLCAYLKGCGGINQFVLIRNSTNYRFDDNIKQMLRRYENMFGRLFWKHLIVVLTRVDQGLSQRQFMNGEKDKDMRNHIYEEYKLDENEFDIPVIPIGLDNYEQAIETFVESLAENKFECEQIKSPLQELRANEAEIQIRDNQAKQRIDSLNQQIQNIQTQINSL